MRIFHHPKQSWRDAAKKLLGWMVCAKRPLMWHEIQGAVAIRLEDGTIDFDERRLRVSAKELCGSLVDVHTCGTVELVHSTARKYVDLSLPPNLEATLANPCTAHADTFSRSM
jgi:hypothetical protein